MFDIFEKYRLSPLKWWFDFENRTILCKDMSVSNKRKFKSLKLRNRLLKLQLKIKACLHRADGEMTDLHKTPKIHTSLMV